MSNYQTKHCGRWLDDEEESDPALKKILDGLEEESKRATTREQHQAIKDRYCEAVDKYNASFKK